MGNHSQILARSVCSNGGSENPALWRQPLYAAVALLAGGFLIGCAASGVARARAEIAKGNYSAAHHELELAAADRSRLSRRDVRELNDALCLTEYKIGAPSYSMAEQQRACSEAATLDGSQSGPLLATIEQNRRAALSDAIENSLAQGDIAEAEQQIRDYRSIPGDDDVAVAKWSREVWSLVRERDHRHAKEHAGRIEPAISAVARQYPEVKTMNDRRFRQWIERNATVSGTPLVSEVEIGRRTVNLWVTDGSRPAAALNLDRFARINDALIARCRCDGHTNVALKGSGLPAYLVRLDPEIRQSEVIILSNP